MKEQLADPKTTTSTTTLFLQIPWRRLGNSALVIAWTALGYQMGNDYCMSDPSQTCNWYNQYAIGGAISSIVISKGVSFFAQTAKRAYYDHQVNTYRHSIDKNIASLLEQFQNSTHKKLLKFNIYLYIDLIDTQYAYYGQQSMYALQNKSEKLKQLDSELKSYLISFEQAPKLGEKVTNKLQEKIMTFWNQENQDIYEAMGDKDKVSALWNAKSLTHQLSSDALAKKEHIHATP